MPRFPKCSFHRERREKLLPGTGQILSQLLQRSIISIKGKNTLIDWINSFVQDFFIYIYLRGRKKREEKKVAFLGAAGQRTSPPPKNTVTSKCIKTAWRHPVGWSFVSHRAANLRHHSLLIKIDCLTEVDITSICQKQTQDEIIDNLISAVLLTPRDFWL